MHRGLDAQGRPPRLPAGDRGDDKDRVSAICGRWTSGSTASASGRSKALPLPLAGRQAGQGRSDGHVRSKAVVIAYGVHESGRREVIDLDVGEIESEAFWVDPARAARRGLPASASAPPMPARGPEGRRSHVCWAAPGSAAQSISSATCTSTAAQPSAGWSQRWEVQSCPIRRTFAPCALVNGVVYKVKSLACERGSVAALEVVLQNYVCAPLGRKRGHDPRRYRRGCGSRGQHRCCELSIQTR